MEAIIFLYEKETPGSVRYQELDAANRVILDRDKAHVGTLYVRKSMLARLSPLFERTGEPPMHLQVTLAEAKI